ncbi:MAG: radical SAM protein [Candidatus Hadarchaeales archaeon]
MRVYHLAWSPALREVYLHFHGCNFRCLGCVRRKYLYDVHLSEPPKGSPRFLGLEEVLELLERAGPLRAFLVGGEPTLDPQLPFLLEGLKDRGVSVYLLTNGYELREEVLERVDGVCLSLKAYSPPLHRFLTGKDNEKVLENLVGIYERGIPLSSETVHFPGFVEKEEIGKIAEFISLLDDGIPYHLDAYLPVSGKWRGSHPWEVEEAAMEARKYLRRVTYFTGKEKTIGEVVSLFP